MPSPYSDQSFLRSTHSSPSLNTTDILKQFRFKKVEKKFSNCGSGNLRNTENNPKGVKIESENRHSPCASKVPVKIIETPESILATIPNTSNGTMSIKRPARCLQINSDSENDDDDATTSNIDLGERDDTASDDSIEVLKFNSVASKKKRRRLISCSDDDDENSVSSPEKKLQSPIVIDSDTTASLTKEESSQVSSRPKGVHFISDSSGDESDIKDETKENNKDDSDDENSGKIKSKPRTTVIRRNKAVCYLDTDSDSEDADGKDDSDDVYSNGSEDSESETDSPVKKIKPRQLAVLNFFNKRTPEELMFIQNLSKTKVNTILRLRPFLDWNDLNTKLDNEKGITTDILIDGAKRVMSMQNSIMQLMIKCEALSTEMESVVNELVEGEANASCLREQPRCLNPNLKLAPYQLIGLTWMVLMQRKNVNGILADEMGLGKTVQTIALLAHLWDQGVQGPHIIVVPSSTLDNWIRELNLWCNKLDILVYYGSLDERRSLRKFMKKSNRNFSVLLTTYAIVMNNEEDRSAVKSIQFHTVVYDEAHLLKNMNTMRFKYLMKISGKHRLLLTGTPLQNNLSELMSLLVVVMPNLFVEKLEEVKHLFGTVIKNNNQTRSPFEQERIEHAKKLIRPFILRRLKSNVLKDLPPKVEYVEYIDMTDLQSELYTGLIKKFSSETKEKRELLASQGASIMVNLRKMANHPLLMRNRYSDEQLRKMSQKILKEPSHYDANPEFVFQDMQVMSDFELHRLSKLYKSLASFALPDEDILNSGKFLYLDSVLDDHKSQGNRILLYSQFTMVLDIVEEYMKIRKRVYIRLDGSTPVNDRQALIDSFNTDKNIFVFLLSTKAGGVGINLTAANVVIIHDIDFNPYNDKQAEDRCHRVGQKQEVTIVRLLSKCTVEEGIMRCAKKKLKLEEDVTNAEDTEDSSAGDMISLLKVVLAVE